MSETTNEWANKTAWLDSGWLPFHYAFVPSKEAWVETLKEYGLDTLKSPWPEDTGSCSPFEDKEAGDLIILITLQPQKKYPVLCGLAHHEVAHAWQIIKEFINENSPSPEFEAYALQAMSKNVVEAALRAWGLSDHISDHPI